MLQTNLIELKQEEGPNPLAPVRPCNPPSGCKADPFMGNLRNDQINIIAFWSAPYWTFEFGHLNVCI